MKKTLDSMKGNRYLMKKRAFTFTDWVDVDGQIRVFTDGDDIVFNKSEAHSKVEDMKLLAVKKSESVSKLQPIEDVLMGMVDRLQQDPGFVGQAKEINSSVTNLINIQKLRLQIVKMKKKGES